MLKINYDVTLSEIETAYMLFWKKYNRNRAILFSVIYSIAAVLFINMVVVSSGENMLPWIGAALSLGMLASTWLRPLRARKRIRLALEMEYIDRYIATFGENRIEIETVAEDSGSDNEPESQASKSQYVLSTEELHSEETSELFLLYVNRAYTHIFPKRCLSQEEAKALRDYFEEKKI